MQNDGRKKTKMTVIVNQVFEKACLFKSKVETETLNGMRKYYEIVQKELSNNLGNVLYLLFDEFLHCE